MFIYRTDHTYTAKAIDTFCWRAPWIMRP